MRRKLYGNNIQPCCEYCQSARRATDGRVMLCSRRGIVPMYHKCRKFRYAPCKRIPPKPKAPDFSDYTKEDFSL